MTDPSVRDALQELIESARLLGATQAKKGFGCYTPDDARFEHAMYESIAKHKAALSKQEAATPAEFVNAWNAMTLQLREAIQREEIAHADAKQAEAQTVRAIARINELEAALKAAQPVPLNVAAQEQRSGLSDARHDSPQANETPPPVAATPAPQEPAEPVAWIHGADLMAMRGKDGPPYMKGAMVRNKQIHDYDTPLYTQSVADAQDAGRYRWLKDKSGFDIRSLLDVGDFTSLNAHIDAAMALDVTKRDPKGD
jgi:hypothetical protein